MSNEKPEALRLAEWCEENSPSIYRQSAETAKELRRLHARVQELEAMLESVGAGGVSAQRVTQGKDHIAQPLEMVAAPVVLPEPVAAQIRPIKEERWRTIALVLYDLFAGDEYERRYIYTEQQVRELLATGGQPQADARDAERVTQKAAPVMGPLPAIGSRVFIRHGRDAYACTVTGYYAWCDNGGNKHRDRVFARLVYEDTNTAQTCPVSDCYPSAEAALTSTAAAKEHK